MDLAKDLRKELRQVKFERHAELLSNYPFFKEFKNYPQSYEALGGLLKLRCKKTCKGGGSNPLCKIRICCKKKSLNGCWECEFEHCIKLDFLKPMHGNAHIKNLRIIKKKGTQSLSEEKDIGDESRGLVRKLFHLT